MQMSCDDGRCAGRQDVAHILPANGLGLYVRSCTSSTQPQNMQAVFEVVLSILLGAL